MLRRTMLIIVVAIVVIVVISAVSAAFLLQPKHSTTSKTLVYYSQYDVQTLDPADAYDSGSFIPIQNSYDTLVTYPMTTIGQLIPGLATSWNVSSNGLVYTFHLRHNVKFSNGDSFTAQDVVFTFQRVLEMNSPSSGVAWIDSQDLNSSSIVALDNYTVQFTLTHVFNPFLETLATAEPNAIVDMKAVKANGGVVANKDNSWMANNTVGTGPYKVQSWTKAQQVVLVQNPNYWGGWNGTHYTKIVILLNTQPATAISASRSGAATLADIPFSQASSLNNATNLKVISNAVPRTKLIGFDLNSSHTFMANKSVRIALSWAFPYQQVISTAFQSYATPLNGAVPTQIYLGQQAMPSKYYSYNLAKAAAILDQAGFTNNSNGQRFNGTALTIYSDSAVAWQTTVDQLYQAALAKIGITLDIKSVPASTGYSVQGTNQWDMMIDTWGPDYNDPSDYALPFIGGAAIGGDVYSTHFNDSIINNAILNAMVTTSTQTEISDYNAVWVEANQNPSLIYVAVTDHIAAVSNTLTNFSYNAIITYNFYHYFPSTATSSVVTQSPLMARADHYSALNQLFIGHSIY